MERRLIFHGSDDCGHTTLILQVYFMFQAGNKYSALGQQQVTWNPMDMKDHKTLQLQQLYKNGSKATEESNSVDEIAGTNNVTSS
jgi:hypothetical protein